MARAATSHPKMARPYFAHRGRGTRRNSARSFPCRARWIPRSWASDSASFYRPQIPSVSRGSPLRSPPFPEALPCKLRARRSHRERRRTIGVESPSSVDHVHSEHHRAVALAAKVRALALKCARLVGRESHLGGITLLHGVFHVKVRDFQSMRDIIRREHDRHRLAFFHGDLVRLKLELARRHLELLRGIHGLCCHRGNGKQQRRENHRSTTDKLHFYSSLVCMQNTIKVQKISRARAHRLR